jgi:hypothetical protein
MLVCCSLFLPSFLRPTNSADSVTESDVVSHSHNRGQDDIRKIHIPMASLLQT